jgi:hypothetical protein
MATKSHQLYDDRLLIDGAQRNQIGDDSNDLVSPSHLELLDRGADAKPPHRVKTLNDSHSEKTALIKVQGKANEPKTQQ